MDNEAIKTELNNINSELKDRENNLSVDERNKAYVYIALEKTVSKGAE